MVEAAVLIFHIIWERVKDNEGLSGSAREALKNNATTLRKLIRDLDVNETYHAKMERFGHEDRL